MSYSSVHALVPTLLPPAATPAPDIVLHIGLAASRTFYAVEDGAHARGYGVTADVDGEVWGDEVAEEGDGVLGTGFDTGDVVGRWRAHFASSSTATSQGVKQVHGVNVTPDLRANPDAGNFLCGFIYYNSLARYHELNGEHGERPVVFLHVPDLTASQEKLDEGRAVAIALIKALVESRREVGVARCGKSGGGGGAQEDDRRNNTAV